jgi:hypothetical protein
MPRKGGIALACAMALISIGAILWRQSASPMRESAGDAVWTARKGSSFASLSPVVGPRDTQESFISYNENSESLLAAEMHPAASSWAAEAAGNDVRFESIEAVAIAWANQDLERAIEWGRQLSDQTERQRALICIGFEAARAEPLTALALALELKRGAERDELIRHSVGEWAAIAPEAAAEWADQIEEPLLRARTLAHVATAWAEIEPRAAAKMAIEQLKPGRLQEDTVVSIVQRWAQQQPTDAAAWVTTFGEGDLRAAAFQNLVKLWGEQNAAEAGDWLKTLPPNSTRSTAIAAYVEQIAPAYPQHAQQWAEYATLTSQ